MERITVLTTDPFYSKKITCLFCNQDFKVIRVRSRYAIPFKIDSDFCTHYRSGNYAPYYYYVDVCPACGFAFTEEFTGKFAPGSREIIQARIEAQWDKRDYNRLRDAQDAIDCYKLAIYAGNIKHERHVAMAGLCLRLAWIYRTQQNTGQEQRFLTLALNEYEESYKLSDFKDTKMTEMRVLFLCGELSRRLGQYNKAVLYFSRVIEHPEADNEIKTVNMAREQWGEAVRQYREETRQEQTGEEKR